MHYIFGPKSKADVHKEVSKLATLTQQNGISEDLVKELMTLVQGPTKLSDDDTKKILIIIIATLKSQEKDLVDDAEDILVALKKSKSLNWKKHIDEAKEMLKVIGELPIDDRDTVRQYEDFLKQLLDLLKKGKVLSEVQGSLVDCFFNCILVKIPAKSDLAEECSDRDKMDLSKQPALRQKVLEGCERLLQMEDLPKDNRGLNWAMGNIMERVVESYDDNGKKVTDRENQLFMSIFKLASDGTDTIEEQFYQEDNESIPNVYLKIWRDALSSYISMHQSSRTLPCIAPIMHNILKWTKIAVEAEHEDFEHWMFSKLHTVGMSPPPEFNDILPEIIDMMLTTKKCNELFTFITQLYPHNPKAVHDRLQNLLDGMENMKDAERGQISWIFHTVAQEHPEAFTQQQIATIFDRYRRGSQHEQISLLMVIQSVTEKHPANLANFLPQLCDDSVFKPDSLNLRSGIISCIGGINEKLGQKAVDYLMKYADYSDTTISWIVVGSLSAMVRDHVDYMQKHKSKLQQLEKTSTMPQVRDLVHDMILELEGKSLENIAEDVQQQQEDIIELDTKVDTTVNTVIAIGDKVIEHDTEIGELGVGLEMIEERVDDVEEDISETKIKVEEIDNKTMSNAPRWSRDLTKLMNPEAENDWRLLASRLGYCNDDIRGWATQHDPCMALLSEWYATHKTSEANFGVMNALTEMNRMDGVAIVENAMKASEGVVEDEEFEYPSPPPVFISYQWGFQNEVKLLKQHLNMAGYECWMDVGQMGGGDKLFAKIDNGIRGANVVICCVTDKYAQSPNCNREVNLSVNLNKPIIPLLMEKMDWPPKGSMGPIFSEYLFIRFFQRGGEETTEDDQRYWPVPKFQELLMQLNFFVVPDQNLVQKEYASWWAPITEDIVVDKTKSKKQQETKKPKTSGIQIAKPDRSPLVFLSYQWGKQPQVKALYHRLTSLGYTVWMDIYQMGGGDSLYDKIDRGMRGCKAVVSCVTQKYTLSANCRREISLADALKKPIIPLLLEQTKWPPDGPMSMVFTELLYINLYRDEAVQMTWTCEQFNELKGKLCQFVPDIAISVEGKDKMQTPWRSETTTTYTANASKETRKSDAKGNRKTAKDKTSSDGIKTEVDTGKVRSKDKTKEKSKTFITTNTAEKTNKSATKNLLTKAASVGAFTKDRQTDTGTNETTSGSRKPVNDTMKENKSDSGAAIVNTEASEQKGEIAAALHSDVIPTAPDKSTLYNDCVAEKNDKMNCGYNNQPAVVLPNIIKTENNQKKSSSCIIL